MRSVTNSFRLLAASLLILAAGCGDDHDVTTYAATTFQVTQTGQNPQNILAAGGSLTIAIAADNSTGGSLFIPASAAGGTAFIADMAGTASFSGSTVTFTQGADTFVRDLTFTVVGSTLQVTNQIVSGTTYNITLTKQ
jgi:hypothetical protein